MDNVIHLAFENVKAMGSDHQMLACAACKNKTFTARTDLGDFPVLYCAACTCEIGIFGWAPKEGA